MDKLESLQIQSIYHQNQKVRLFQSELKHKTDETWSSAFCKELQILVRGEDNSKKSSCRNACFFVFFLNQMQIKGTQKILYYFVFRKVVLEYHCSKFVVKAKAPAGLRTSWTSTVSSSASFSVKSTCWFRGAEACWIFSTLRILGDRAPLVSFFAGVCWLPRPCEISETRGSLHVFLSSSKRDSLRMQVPVSASLNCFY